MQGIEVFAACGDTVTFVCALALLLLPTSSVQYNLIIGQLMIASQARLWLPRFRVQKLPCGSFTVGLQCCCLCCRL